MALTPPRKSVELEDPGAHELESSEGESDAFQDASEGQKTGSGPASPVPIMRVEKVDNDESYGEVPGTEAYKMRGKDAVPDEIEIVPDGRKSRSSSNFSTPQMSPVGPGESPVPKTVVEKVDPMSPSHGDVPGTAAFSRRRADAVPDEIRPIGDSDSHPDTSESHDPRRDISIPTTVVTKVDSNPSHGEVPGTAAYEIRTQDAEPDVVEKKGDVADVPTSSLSRSTREAFGQRRPSLEGPSPIAADGGFGPMRPDVSADDKDGDDEGEEKDEDDGFGDDFDDFEAGGEADDDFGDFDVGVDKPSQETQRPPPAPDIPFDIPSFSPPFSPSDLNPHLSALFPTVTQPLPPSTDFHPPPRDAPNPIFPSDRSLSLWHQLSTPPPLQPPNWLRSRIRRLFLVSLGVPVDLDEILPKSKQGRLVLPSMERILSAQENSSSSSRLGVNDDSAANDSTTSLGSTTTTAAAGGGSSKKRSATNTTKSKNSAKTRGGGLPPQPPDLDIAHVKALAALKKSDAEIDELSDAQLKAFVEELEGTTRLASEVLEYWLKRRDEAKGEKEAFEGVIENLVRHARRQQQNVGGGGGGKKGRRK